MDGFFWRILFVQQLVEKVTIPMKRLLFAAIINIVLKNFMKQLVVT